MQIRYNKEKNEWLREKRGITFQDVADIIKSGKYLSIKQNPSRNHRNQKCFIININDYIYLVPYVEESDYIFLKTIYRSRKYTAIYL